MSDIRVAPATADRFGDVERALTGGGDGASCWCQWWMHRNQDFQATTNAQRRDLLRADLDAPVSSALIAYVDGGAAGWVKVAPRTDQPRIATTRNLRLSPEPLDDPSVWAITCFVVRREARGQGIARRLLEAAVSHAREHGARTIEAYPVDTSVKKTSTNDLYHGALSSFIDAGLAEVARPVPARPIVSLAVR